MFTPDRSLVTEVTLNTTATTLRDEANTAVRVPAGVIEGLVTALDTRDPRALVVAQASDSTGDSAAEWFEIAWKELLAEYWPDRPGRVQRWVKDTDVYTPTTTWQDASPGSTTAPVTLIRDTFTTARTNLSGTTDESGHTWTVTGTAIAAAANGVLAQTGPGTSFAAVTLDAHNGIDGTTASRFTIVTTGATQQVTLVHTSNGVNNGNRLELLIGGTTSNGPILKQVIAGVTTNLATFPAGHLNWSTEITVDASITVSGTAVSTTINGTTLTATLDPAVFGKTYTYLALNNAQGVKVDSFERTSTLTTPIASPLGWLTAYNGGYAGGRAEHQLARLDAMYPVRPDVLFINHGHNYHAIDSTPEAFVAALDTFVDALHTKYPGVPVVCLSQNPNYENAGRTAAQVAGHHAQQRHLRAACRERGWGYIPGFEAFMALPDSGKSLVNADGVHPSTGAQAGTGARLQADVAKRWVGRQSRRPELPPVLTSANGTRFRLAVGDDGALTTTSL